MGVPKLFQIILDRFPESHRPVSSETKISHLLIDFNCLIYEAREKVIRQPNVTSNNVEQRIIQQVIETLQEMIYLVDPQQLVYFAFDGPAPRGKMILQRQRRYRKLLEDEIIQSYQAKYGEPIPNIWPTAQVTPGTPFMTKMSQAVEKAIKGGRFPTKLDYILSDTTVPGEGEHKFLPYLDQLPSSSVAIYSNDGDLLILGHRVPQHSVYILTKPKATSRVSQKYYRDAKYFYVDMAGVGDGFMIEAMCLSRTPRPSQLARLAEAKSDKEKSGLPSVTQLTNQKPVSSPETTKSEPETLNTESDIESEKKEEPPIIPMIRAPPKFPPPYRKDRILHDYLFYSMFGGNDYVHHILFLQMKEHDTLEILLRIYRRYLPEYGYLVERTTNKVKINHEFFVKFIEEITNHEERHVKFLEKKTRTSQPKKNKTKFPPDAPQWEKDWDHFQHTYYFKEDHPQFELFRELFRTINYYAPPHVWKQQYYRHFFHFNYRTNKNKLYFICQQYLKSLIYALNYYLIGPPNWHWYYPFRAAPMPSDLLDYLNNHADINSLNWFPKDQSFKPLEQLMLVLPKETDLLPLELKKIMDNHPEYYPEGYDLDVLWGMKFIYSEPILPNIKVPVIMQEMSKVKLSPKWQQLNKLQSEPKYFSATGKSKSDQLKPKQKPKQNFGRKAKKNTK